MSKMIALTLAIFAVATSCQALDLSPLPMAKLDLTDFLSKSSDAMQRNPELTTQCFNTYKPQIDGLAGEYKQKLDGCHNAAVTSKDRINSEVAGNVQSIDQWRNEICGSYNKCSQQAADPQVFFECNNAAAGEAMTTSYNIQTMSKDRMEYVSVQYQMIAYTQKSCADKSESEYVENSKKLYDELQDCMAGKLTTAAPQPPTTAEN